MILSSSCFRVFVAKGATSRPPVQMTTPDAALLSLLHLCDSLFPIGSFAYSDGLESAAANGLVTGTADLWEWLEILLEEGFGRSDGPSIVLAWAAVGAADGDAIVAIDEELTALRASSTARLANRSMGLRLLKTWHGLYPDVRLERLLALVHARRLGPTLPVAFAAVGYCGGIAQRDALAGYAYARLAATISAAMRLVAIGQTDAHRLLSLALARVPSTIDGVLARQARPESFAPALDIAQMSQQYLHARLFRS
jgi:urease accessory protein